MFIQEAGGDDRLGEEVRQEHTMRNMAHTISLHHQARIEIDISN